MNNTKSRILPLELISPITYDLPSHSALNAALSQEEVDDRAWEFLFERYTYIHCINSKKLINRYNNYKKKMYNKDFMNYNEIHITYPKNPFIKHTFNIISTVNPDRTLKKIIKYINQGKYIRIKLDTYYLPGYLMYQKGHLNHSEIIYGYDLENEKLYVCGHSYLSEKGMQKNEISFQDFLDSFKSATKGKSLVTIVCDKICTKTRYKFNLKKMYRGLSDYYTANDSVFMWLRTQMGKNPIAYWEAYAGHVFGISLPTHLKAIMEYSNPESRLGLASCYSKIFVALSDFSNLMKQRVKFLKENYFEDCDFTLQYNPNELLEKFDVISNNYLILRNYLFKTRLVRDDEKRRRVVEKIIDLLDRTYQLECEAGKELLANLKAIIDKD